MNGKVLIIINVDWYFDLHWLDRAKYLKDAGFKVTIATQFTSTALYQKFINEGLDCQPLTLNRFSINIISEIKSLIQIHFIIKKIQPSIIQAVTVKPNIYCGIVNKSIPVIYSITGLGTVFSSRAYRFKLIKPLILWAYRRTSKRSKAFFLFENIDDFDRMKSHNVFTNNATIIKGAGINEKTFYYTPPPNNRTVLFAARLLKAKGLYVLIDAMKILRAMDINITLKIAGIPDYEADSAITKDEIKALSNDPDIEWLGNTRDMPSIIRQSDIVCLPTEYAEGIPRILIEAASSGRAIIATNVTGCREIVEDNHNGLLVAVNDPTALAGAIHKIICNKKLSRYYGLMGRKKVLTNFCNKTVLTQMQALYKNIIM